jgi:diguanylate cyclase (GGDEF)-like protein
MTPVRERDQKLYELSIFHDVAKALTSSLDLDTILHTIMEKMAAYFEPATWALLMVDEPTKELYFAASVGQNCEPINSLRLVSGESLAKWVLENGDLLFIESVRNDARLDSALAAGLFPHDCSIVCMPVRTGGNVLGIIQLANIDAALYERNKLLLQTLADYAAIAIENARAVKRIQELSITDDCTGLYNQRHLFTVLNDEVHRSARFGFECSLLFLDLDHFKRVNDSYGHLVGSRLIALVGQCLRENLRLIDAAFRYGGDEFTIVLPQTSKDSALFVGRRIAAAFHRREWRPADDVSITLRTSIGIATYPEDADSPLSLVQLSDQMMYQVKQAGRDNIAVAGRGIVGLVDPPSSNGHH